MKRFAAFVGVNDGSNLSVQVRSIDADSEEAVVEIVEGALEGLPDIQRVTDVLVYDHDGVRALLEDVFHGSADYVQGTEEDI